MACREMSRAECFAMLGRIDPHFAGLIAELHGAIDGFDVLTPRLQRLCGVASAAGFEAEAQLVEQLEGCEAAGVAPADALETIFYTMSFAGFRALSKGLTIFVETFGEEAVRGLRPEDFPPGPSIDGYDGPALEVGIEMYGPRRARGNIDNFRAIGTAFSDALERYAYAGVFRRRVLSPLEREIASVAMLSVLEKPTPFAWHAKAALRLGATPDQLKYAVVQQIPIGGVLRAFAALRPLSELVSDWRAHPAADDL
jgi:alkylhydroperoxidase/carboxymuconolactone decarboxylase family protein YurZ